MKNLFKVIIAGLINSIDLLKGIVIESQIDSLVIFCPCCGHDINDHDSFVKTEDKGGRNHTYYQCCNCGSRSEWNVFDIFPIAVNWDRIRHLDRWSPEEREDIRELKEFYRMAKAKQGGLK